MADSGQSGRAPLVLTGELGIQRAEELHQILLHALDQAQWLEVDLSQAREVGLCCLQLICSAHRSARQHGKRLTIRPGVSPELGKALARAGFSRPQGCVGPEDPGSLWSMEDLA